MRPLALSPTQQRRLEKLAREAGRTPQAMLRFVLREGFDACEEDVRENLTADAEFASGRSYPHADVMARGKAIIERHSRGHKQAA